MIVRCFELSSNVLALGAGLSLPRSFLLIVSRTDLEIVVLVFRSLIRVSQYFPCLVDEARHLRCVGIFVVVWIPLCQHATVGASNLFVSRVGRDT